MVYCTRTVPEMEKVLVELQVSISHLVSIRHLVSIQYSVEYKPRFQTVKVSATCVRVVISLRTAHTLMSLVILGGNYTYAWC